MSVIVSVCVCVRCMCACARVRVRLYVCCMRACVCARVRACVFTCVHILLIDCTENILKFCIIKNFCFINILLSVCTHYGL